MLPDGMHICSGEYIKSQDDQEVQHEIAGEEREEDYEEEPLDPRQLVVTIVTARDVPVNTRAPSGGGLYVVVEFEGQVHMLPCECVRTICAQAMYRRCTVVNPRTMVESPTGGHVSCTLLILMLICLCPNFYRLLSFLLSPFELSSFFVCQLHVSVFISCCCHGMKPIFLSFQVRKTASRLWSENVVLNTSQTFGVTHESRFFDWGEQIIFTLPDMDRIVRIHFFLSPSLSLSPPEPHSCPGCFLLV